MYQTWYHLGSEKSSAYFELHPMEAVTNADSISLEKEEQGASLEKKTKTHEFQVAPVLVTNASKQTKTNLQQTVIVEEHC